MRLYLIVTEKLKKPNDVKTSILLTRIGKQGHQIYNNFKFSSVNDEMDYDIIITKFREYRIPRKKFNTSMVHISHLSTRQGRNIQRHCKKIKNAESRAWIKGIWETASSSEQTTSAFRKNSNETDLTLEFAIKASQTTEATRRLERPRMLIPQKGGKKF